MRPISWWSAGTRIWNQNDGTRWARYTADGSQVGTIAGPYGTDAFPCAATLSVAASGNAILTWGVEIQADPSGTGSPSSSCEVHGQHFAADDTALDAAFLIDGGTAQINQPVARYAAAVDGNGNLVLTWLATVADLTPEIVGRTVTAP